jgi:hypothetical protein
LTARFNDVTTATRLYLSYSKPSDKRSQCLKYGIGASKERRSLLGSKYRCEQRELVQARHVILSASPPRHIPIPPRCPVAPELLVLELESSHLRGSMLLSRASVFDLPLMGERTWRVSSLTKRMSEVIAGRRW